MWDINICITLGCVTAIFGYVASIKLLGCRDFSGGWGFLDTCKLKKTKTTALLRLVSAYNVMFSSIGQSHPKGGLKFFQQHC